MYIEPWMGIVFLAWWGISIWHITSSAKRYAYAEGVDAGTESTLHILETNGIIKINGEEISSTE
jgi:hypothetical protein